MKKNLEFYKMLEESVNNPEKINEELCLISNVSLNEYAVTLACGHKFDYVALYKEYYSQKFCDNGYHNSAKAALKCPYCRQCISNVLPYYPDLNLDLIYGINTDDIEYKMVISNSLLIYAKSVEYHKGNCCFVFLKKAQDDDVLEDVTCKSTFVVLHKETNKTYCGSHIGVVRRNYKKEATKAIRTKIQLEHKQKLLIKKQTEKDEKQKQKILEKEAAKNKKKDENVIVSMNTVIPLEIDDTKCIQILKYGKNKGGQCGCKIFKDNVCKKHVIKETKEIKELKELKETK